MKTIYVGYLPSLDYTNILDSNVALPDPSLKGSVPDLKCFMV